MATLAHADFANASDSWERIYWERGPELVLNRGKFREFLKSNYLPGELIELPGKRCPILREGECSHDVYHVRNMTLVYDMQSRPAAPYLVGLGDEPVAERRELKILVAGPAREREELGASLRAYVSRLTAR